MNGYRKARRTRDLLLALCLGWLLVQNLALLSLAPWDRLGVLSTVGSAMLKALWALCLPIVTTVLAAALAWAFTIGLLRAPLEPRELEHKELRHG